MCTTNARIAHVRVYHLQRRHGICTDRCATQRQCESAWWYQYKHVSSAGLSPSILPNGPALPQQTYWPLDASATCNLRTGVRRESTASQAAVFCASPLLIPSPLVRWPPVMKGCHIVACGLIRCSGSHVRHLEMKSTKSSSLHRRTWASDSVPGWHRLSFEFTTGRGPSWLSEGPAHSHCDTSATRCLQTGVRREHICIARNLSQGELWPVRTWLSTQS